MIGDDMRQVVWVQAFLAALPAELNPASAAYIADAAVELYDARFSEGDDG